MVLNASLTPKEKSATQTVTICGFFLECCIRNDSHMRGTVLEGHIVELLRILLDPAKNSVQLSYMFHGRTSHMSLQCADENHNIHSCVCQVCDCSKQGTIQTVKCVIGKICKLSIGDLRV